MTCTSHHPKLSKNLQGFSEFTFTSSSISLFFCLRICVGWRIYWKSFVLSSHKTVHQTQRALNSVFKMICWKISCRLLYHLTEMFSRCDVYLNLVLWLLSYLLRIFLKQLRTYLHVCPSIYICNTDEFIYSVVGLFTFIIYYNFNFSNLVCDRFFFLILLLLSFFFVDCSVMFVQILAKFPTSFSQHSFPI